MASIRKKGRNWHFEFTDEHGHRKSRKGCSDRRETVRMAAAAENEVEKIKAGLIDRKAVNCAAHEASPIGQHLTDWHDYLVGSGFTGNHAKLRRNRAQRLLALGSVRRVSDLSPSAATAGLKALRESGLSLQSIKHYTSAVKGFSRWLHRDGRAREHVLAYLSSPNADADRRRERQALTADEMHRLLEATERSITKTRLSGPDRAMLYRLALLTGLRLGELRSLTPRSFDLTPEAPSVTVNAAYSKRRRTDVQPLPAPLAAMLAPWLAGRSPDAPVFAQLGRRPAEILRRDLERAGIPYRDDAGRVVDFHALRTTYVSTLARSGAPVKVVQTLARHSTPVLTLNTYTKLQVNDQRQAIEALPDLTRAPESKGRTRRNPATGTH